MVETEEKIKRDKAEQERLRLEKVAQVEKEEEEEYLMMKEAIARLPPQTQEEQMADLDEFLMHPLNAREITPEMLERPEYQALQELAFEGTPNEVATNFKTHGYSQLGKVLLKQTKNGVRDLEDALYCFQTGLEEKPDDQQILFELWSGKAKANMLRAQFGHTKDDCNEALKIKPQDEQVLFMRARSRYFVEKFEDCLTWVEEALKLFPTSGKFNDLKQKCYKELKLETERMNEVVLVKNVKESKKLEQYRALREKKIKLGKRVHSIPDMVDAKMSIDKKGLITFPVLLVYDEVMQVDLVQEWREDQTFADALRPIFNERAPWDVEGVYRLDCIEVYMECDQTKVLNPKDNPKNKSTKKYVKCGMKDKLLKWLQHENNIIPQYPTFKVISKENDDFRDMFLGEI